MGALSSAQVSPGEEKMHGIKYKNKNVENKLDKTHERKTY